MLINVLIDKIYIYDDSITIMFNIQNKDFSAKYPNISEIESSYLGNNAQPDLKTCKILFFQCFTSFIFIKIRKYILNSFS